MYDICKNVKSYRRRLDEELKNTDAYVCSEIFPNTSKYAKLCILEEREELVAFYGALREELFYNNGEIYDFNFKVFMNTGAAYSQGKFTCPVKGWYLVSVSLQGNGK